MLVFFLLHEVEGWVASRSHMIAQLVLSSRDQEDLDLSHIQASGSSLARAFSDSPTSIQHRSNGSLIMGHPVNDFTICLKAQASNKECILLFIVSDAGLGKGKSFPSLGQDLCNPFYIFRI